MNTNTTNNIEQHLNLQNQKINLTTNSPLALKSKKSLLDEIQKLKTLVTTKNGYNYENFDNYCNDLKILKDRFLITEDNCYLEPLNCIDIHTNEQFLCKVINEPYDKVALAYFRLQNYHTNKETVTTATVAAAAAVTFIDDDDFINEGHHLVRPVYDIIPQSTNNTYLIIRQPTLYYENEQNSHDQNHHHHEYEYENLHSYLRNHKRLQETEARSLFRQICKTVELCHQNGIILRDIKLRKFFFINKERTILQYESLEGAVILNDLNDDTLTDKIGCPLYVSPELITPNSSYGGQAADMWALGVILYTILIGQYPFNDGQGQTIFAKISNCDFYLPNTLSNKARCLIRSLLRRNPEERLNSSDILYHPWFDDKNDKEMLIFDLDRKFDQCVPEYSNGSDMT